MEVEEIIKLLEYVREIERDRYYGSETIIEAIYDKLDDILIEIKKINYKEENPISDLPALQITDTEELPF
ncbi:MAG: hypothetical protein KBT48_09310 [Firmicutes bacterium]|nr:hypothetical protein [Bacillota bacterium]